MNYRRFIIPFIFIVLCYFPLFLQLDSLPLRLYDEARRGVNAMEMLENGNWIVTHYNGQPDMWGTKPPLLIWLQAICMKIFGYNELAVRLPSALAGLATAILLFIFSNRILKSPFIGYFSILVLLTCEGYVTGAHSVRKGDFDALLTLWTTAYTLFFYYFLESKDKKYFYLSCIAIILSVLTKSVAGLFMLPGLLLYTIYKKEFLNILRSKHTYFGILLGMFFIAGFYILRDALNPGYLEQVWQNELGGRYFDELEEQGQSALFYLQKLYQLDFSYWIWFIPFGLIIGLLSKGRLKDLTVLLSINITILLLVISNSQTKLVWYDMPAYPFMGILAGIGLTTIYTGTLARLNIQKEANTAILVLIFFLISFAGKPYMTIFDKIYLDFEERTTTHYGYFVRKVKGEKEYNIANYGYNPNAVFYAKAQRKKGLNVNTFSPTDKLKIGDKIMLCEPKSKKIFDEQHLYTTLQVWEGCILVVVDGYRSTE